MKSSETPPAGFSGTQSTEQIQNILERSKQGQRGMIPNLKKCFKDAYCFLLPSFSGVSQPGTVPFQPVRGCQQHAWEAQSLQLRSHFVTSPVSLAVESSEALQHSVHLTHVLEKQFGFPVKFPKASCYCSSPVCKTIRFMGQGGLALPRTEVAALQRRSLQRSG